MYVPVWVLVSVLRRAYLFIHACVHACGAHLVTNVVHREDNSLDIPEHPLGRTIIFRMYNPTNSVQLGGSPGARGAPPGSAPEPHV